MVERLPRGALGALLGGIGAIPIAAVAAGAASRLGRLPTLPGAERAAGDVKSATYAEAIVFLFVVPAAAFFFGHALPRLLEARSPAGRLSFEWAGAGFALSFFLAQRGVRSKYALVAAAVAPLVLGMGLLAFRRSIRFRRLFSRANRGALARVALAGAALALAYRSGPRELLRLLDDPLLGCAGAGLAAALLLLGAAWRSQAPRALLRRAGDAAWIGVLGAAAAIALSRPVLVVPALATAIAAAAAPIGVRSRRAESAALLILVVACGWKMLHPRVHWLDVFEDGCSLAPAQRYLSGARPYLDVAPVHGWGADGGVDAFVFRRFGATFDVFWMHHDIGATLAFAFLAAASAAALGTPAWGALAFLLALDPELLPFERQTLAFAALFCLLSGVRRRRAWMLAAAGALAGAEIFHSLDYGLVLLAGGALGLVAVAFLSRDARALRGAGAFALGTAAGAIPWLAILGRSGATGAFLHQSFVDAPRWVAEAWNLPTGRGAEMLIAADGVDGFLRSAMGGRVPALFFLLLLAVAATVLLLRAARGALEEVDRAACVALCVAAVAMRVVLGRADAPHLVRYGVFASLPAAWLLYRAWRAERRILFLVLAGGFVLLRLHPIRTLGGALERVAAAERFEPGVAALPPRSDRALMDGFEARIFHDFRRYADSHLGPGETFFDFDNQPTLYFAADRLSPTRYFTVAQYEQPERQREVLAELERTRPPFAVLPLGLYGTLDIPNAERAPEVARYLAENYPVRERVGGWEVARRRGE